MKTAYTDREKIIKRNSSMKTVYTNREKIIKRKINFSINTVFFILFLIQFILLIISNLWLTKYNVDADSAILFDHAIKMFNEKTFFIKGWQNTTTLEIDCALFFAVFIYGITKNIYLAFGISNIVISLLYIWTIHIFANNIKLKKPYVYILLILFFIPYRIGQLDYFNMLFFVGGQYGIKVLIPLMLLSIMTASHQKKAKSYYIFEGIYYFLLFLTSLSSGIYVAICGILPIFICEFIYQFKNISKLRIKSTYIMPKLRVFLISIILIIIGISFSKLLLSDTKSFSMILTDIYKFRDNLFNCILGIFEVFKAIPYNQTNVLSISGVLFVCRFVFVSIFLYTTIYYLNKIKYNARWTNYIMSIFLCNLFILLLTYTSYGSKTFEYRYHLIWILPQFILLIIRLKNILSKSNIETRFLISLCFLGIVGIINFQSIYNLTTKHNNYKNLQIIANKIEVLSPNATVFSLGNEFHEIQDNHILRLIGTYNNDYLFIKSNSNEIRLFNNYKKFLDNSSYSQNNIILSTAKEIDKLPEYIRNQYLLVDKHYIYNIYMANNNKLDYFSGFTENVISRDFPYSPGYLSYDSTLNNDGELITSGKEGIVLKSPNFTVKKNGLYDIYLNYMCKSAETENIGKFCVYVNGELKYYNNITNNDTIVKLEELKLSKDDGNIQFCILNNKNSKIVIKNIEIYNNSCIL